MSVFHRYRTRCDCGHDFDVDLADSVNVSRAPGLRDQILAGTFHRVPCPKCDKMLTVEKPFYYSDTDADFYIRVHPRHDRHLSPDASRALDRNVAKIPESVSRRDRRQVRVVFGLSELREKILAQQLGLDDRLVELLKVLLVYEHPFLVQERRLRLRLNGSTKEELEFVAGYEHGRRAFRLRMPRAMADEMGDRIDEVARYVNRAHRNDSIFAPRRTDHWVNMGRWSPHPESLRRLRDYAKRIRAGKRVGLHTTAFDRMLKRLPRGNQLQAWARRDLRTLFLYAKRRDDGEVQERLFEVRFNKELEDDDWALNEEPDDIDTMWQLLRQLPDTNVEGNTYIDEILLDKGEGGGGYSPEERDIYIGGNELSRRKDLEAVLLHEVGHAVHEKYSTVVNRWLRDRFGWRIYGRSSTEIDRWVAEMGGWRGLSAAKQTQVRRYLRAAAGRGESWDPPPPPRKPAGLPANFGPVLAVEGSGKQWWYHNELWHTHRNKSFFLNYWYGGFCSVHTATVDFVNSSMPCWYAAMSDSEFFAELYTVFYDLDNGYRPYLPDDVVEFFEQEIGLPD